MLVERVLDDSRDLLDQESGLSSSPMNLDFYYGHSSPVSSESSQDHSIPSSPSSEYEWAGSPGQSQMGGRRQHNKPFQGVRVKNSVKELLMYKRSCQMSVGQDQEVNKVQQNQSTAGEFAELKSILLREGKRHASESLVDSSYFKRSAPYPSPHLLTPPQTPTSCEVMEESQKNDLFSSEVNSDIMDIIEMLKTPSNPISLNTVQVNCNSMPQQEEQSVNHCYQGDYSCQPVSSSPPQVYSQPSAFPYQTQTMTQPLDVIPFFSGECASYTPTQQDSLFCSKQQDQGNSCSLGNPTEFTGFSPPNVSPLPSLSPAQGLAGMSFFQWQIEQEERKLASMTQDQLITTDTDGDTFLHIAVAQGRRAVSYVLARKMASIGMLNVKEHNGQSALQVAVAANQHLIVQDLLSLGAQINTADRWGRTPLHVCSEKGHAQTIQAIQKTLMKNGQQLDLEAINYEGLTALHTAVITHNAVVHELQKARQPRSPHVQELLLKNKRLVDSVKLLLQMGASVQAKDRKSGRSAVHMAAEEANVELLRLFLDHPGSLNVINAKAYNGNTALHVAASLQNRLAQVDAVRLLMRKGADPSARNLENEQAVHLVSEGPSGEQVRRILKGKAAQPRASPV
uniref:NFKB inhibitor zeta n=1 Tax=Erpetoichthys calabaricus TaxID=27687 RepID=A0A8C4RK25_ERPCA